MSYNYVYSSGVLNLVPTSTKTSAYTASVNDLVIVDGTSGSPVITLPTAPPNLSCVGVKRYDATYAAGNIPTVAPGGSDAFLGGSTTPAQLLLQGQVFILQYNSATAQWFVRSTDEPLSGLDSRYLSATGNFSPSDYGYISWSYDPAFGASASTAPTAGQAYGVLVPIRQNTTITNVVLSIGFAGATLTSGQCFAGLMDHSGNLLSATADQSTTWQSAGLKTMALTAPQAVTPGMYYVAFFGNGTTMPKFWYSGVLFPNDSAGGQFTSSPRNAADTTHTGLTTAFHTPATFTALATTPFWAAVS